MVQMAVTFRRVAQVIRREGMPGIQKRLVRHVGFPLARFLKRPTFRSVYGVEMVADWQDATFRFCAQGNYGEFLSNFIANQKTPFCFVDIGANQGLYSVLAAQNPICERVYSFEPVPRTSDLLSRNVELNGVAGRCEIVPKALSDKAGPVTISIADGHSGAATIGRSLGKQIEIEAIDGAGFAALMQDRSAPLLVKIDVEGHEPVVIEQLVQSEVSDRIMAIFYECDERWVDAAAMQSTLSAAGFAHIKKLGGGQHYDVLAHRLPLDMKST